jgi:hypothetical protein
MEERIILRKESIGFDKIIIGIALLIAGGAVFINKAELFAIILTLLGLRYFSWYTGTIVDLKKQRVKKFFSIYWFRFGDWIELKNYQYLLVSAGVKGAGEWRHWVVNFLLGVRLRREITVCQLYLVPADKNINRSIILLESFHQKKIEKKAKSLGEILKLEVKNNLC